MAAVGATALAAFGAPDAKATISPSASAWETVRAVVGVGFTTPLALAESATLGAGELPMRLDVNFAIANLKLDRVQATEALVADNRELGGLREGHVAMVTRMGCFK